MNEFLRNSDIYSIYSINHTNIGHFINKVFQLSIVVKREKNQGVEKLNPRKKNSRKAHHQHRQ